MTYQQMVDLGATLPLSRAPEGHHWLPREAWSSTSSGVFFRQLVGPNRTCMVRLDEDEVKRYSDDTLQALARLRQALAVQEVELLAKARPR